MLILHTLGKWLGHFPRVGEESRLRGARVYVCVWGANVCGKAVVVISSVFVSSVFSGILAKRSSLLGRFLPQPLANTKAIIIFFLIGSVHGATIENFQFLMLFWPA